MSTRFDRTAALVGDDGINRLRAARVLVVGIGGVGGGAVECLARSGVGYLRLVDGDVFESSNLNRQLFSTVSALGKNKAIVAKARIAEIADDAEVDAVPEFLTEENISKLLDGVEYCVDAIDDIKNKIALIKACKARGIYVVSAMGAGNRLDCDFEACDIFQTKNDPFARVIRKKLKLEGVTSLDVVCAKSPPKVTPNSAPSSIAAPPLVMGAMLASRIVMRIVGE